MRQVFAPVSPILVGRDDELAVLAERQRLVWAGCGQTVLVMGEPGVGKTRLANELAGRFREAGGLVLRGMCLESEQSTALA
jgi:predicted ATPase